MEESNQTGQQVGVFTTDRDLVIRVWDLELSRLTGVSSDEARGRNLFELFPEIEARGLERYFKRALAEGVVEMLSPVFHGYLIQCRPLTVARHFDWMQQSVSIAPLREEEAITGLMVSVQDVTERMEKKRDRADNLSLQELDARELNARRGRSPESEPLIDALSDKDWRIRRAAVDRAAKRSAPDAIAALLREVQDNHYNIGMLNSALQVLSMTEVDTVSPLIEFLVTQDTDLRIQAALALGQSGDPRAVPPLIEALGDANVNVRYHAIEALGRLRAAEAVESLCLVARTQDFFLAFAAIEALSEIGDARTVTEIIPLLECESLVEPAAAALASLGDETVIPPLTKMLNEGRARPLVVASSLATLYDRFEKDYGEGAYIADLTSSQISSAGAGYLLGALNDEAGEDLRPLALVLGWLEGGAVDRALTRLLGNASVRNEVIEALVRHGDRVSSLLIEQLAAEDLETRESAVNALGRIGDPNAVPALVQKLTEDDELRTSVAHALAKIGDRGAFEPLLGFLGDPNIAVRQAVIGALNSLGSSKMPDRLVDLLSDSEPNVRESATRIAGYFGYPECVALLLDRCRDDEERVRHAAVEQMPFLEDDRAIQSLERAITTETPRVRAAAAKALSLIAAERALPLLNKAFDDPDPWVRYFSAKAIGTHGQHDSIDQLARVAENDIAVHVRIAAIEALGRIGGDRAAEVIRRLHIGTETDVQRAAASALGQITQKNPASNDRRHS